MSALPEIVFLPGLGNLGYIDPAVVFTGEHDGLATPKWSQSLADLLRAPCLIHPGAHNGCFVHPLEVDQTLREGVTSILNRLEKFETVPPT